MPGPEVALWLTKARSDLAAARFLRTNPSLPTEISAFHYQQAVEKAIKGLLVDAGIAPPRSHDLRDLVARLPDSAGLDAAIAEELTPFAVLTRYPGFGSEPGSPLLDRFDSLAGACVTRLERGSSRGG